MSDGTAEKPNTVQLMKNGDLRWNEQPVNEQELEGRIKDAVTADSEMSLVVSADKDAAHGQVVHIMDLAKVAGVTKFAINVMQVGGEKRRCLPIAPAVRSCVKKATFVVSMIIHGGVAFALLTASQHRASGKTFFVQMRRRPRRRRRRLSPSPRRRPSWPR